MAAIIVFGNEKGGTGKSTLAVHVAVALSRSGLTVAVIDGDVRQGSLSQYFANRAVFVANHATTSLRSPTLVDIEGWEALTEEALWERLDRQAAALAADVIVVDTPGSYMKFSERLHACADLIVTPLNDSLLDLAVLADIDPDTGAVIRPSHYAERVWKARQARAARDGRSIQWIVLRNRLSALDAHNKRVMADILSDFSHRVGFQTGPGFGERVIFRELFLQGLTLSDFEDRENGLTWTVSHVAARQELRDLLEILTLGLEAGEAAKSQATR